MAKFAVLFLAVFAFQAASAGVFMQQRFQENTLGDYDYGLQLHGHPTGKFDALFGQLQTVSQDLTVYFQKALPNDRLVIKTLVWQCRELAHYIDNIIEKLQAETYNYNGQVRIVLEQVISELRDIKMQYHQISAYTTDVYAVSQMKNQFYMTVQHTVVQLEKLVRLVQTDFEQTEGELYVIVKNVITDFLYAFQNIYTHVQYYGVYGEQSPRQLVLQIQEVTNGLTGYLQGLTHFDAQRKYAVREYVQHIEAIMTRMQQVEGKFNVETDAVFQQVYSKLRRVLVPLMQMLDAEYMENVEVMRMQLIRELQFVDEAFEQFLQFAHAGDYQTFLFEILGDYLYTIQHFRMQMKSGYQSHYGLYQSGFYGMHAMQGMYGKSGFQGLYKYGGLYGKTGYGYGFHGKYQGFAKYGQDFKLFEVQIQTIIRDLYQALQTVSFDDVTIRQTWMHMMREYAQQLEMIVERLHQYVTYNAETDVYMFQQIAQNLRQYVLALQQWNYSEYSAMELKTQFYMYVQQIAAEFEKLMSGRQQTNGSFYELVQNMLVQYLTATHNLYKHMENINVFAQHGYEPYARQYYGDNYYSGKYSGKYFGGKYGQYYGLQGQQMYETPREMMNQIQHVASDLSSTFQNGMFFNQQHAQVLSVQTRHFTKFLKNVIDQLESYEHVDTVIQQVIYKLREVQMSLQQLASSNVFTNVHQLRTEFDNYMQIVIAQIEKLVLIAQEETHGNFYYVIKSVLHYFLYGLHDMHHQIQEVAQYGQMSQYGKGYGFRKYGPQYGFDKYTHGLMSLGQYGKGYGYGFQNQYGYQHLPYAYTQYSMYAY